jgi:hypothetical protein
MLASFGYSGQETSMEVTQKISVELNIFSEDGVAIGEENRCLDFDALQIADIVDHATQLVIVRRSGRSASEVELITEQIEDALTVYGVLSEDFP